MLSKQNDEKNDWISLLENDCLGVNSFILLNHSHKLVNNKKLCFPKRLEADFDSDELN